MVGLVPIILRLLLLHWVSLMDTLKFQNWPFLRCVFIEVPVYICSRKITISTHSLTSPSTTSKHVRGQCSIRRGLQYMRNILHWEETMHLNKRNPAAIGFKQNRTFPPFSPSNQSSTAKVPILYTFSDTINLPPVSCNSLWSWCSKTSDCNSPTSANQIIHFRVSPGRKWWFALNKASLFWALYPSVHIALINGDIYVNHQ